MTPEAMTPGSMTLVKICGICRAEDAAAAVEAGADLLGFHFCSSPRRVAPEQALEIIGQLHRRPQLVGVFIDASEAEVEEVASLCQLDLVQLHGSEAPGFRSSRRVMKVLKVRDGQVPDASAWPDPIMLDSWTPDQRGGSGRTWAWEQGREVVRKRRVFIAGGLRADNVGDLVRAYKPYGVDVSSGVEAEPRRKDADKIQRFIEAVREANSERG